MMHYKVCYSLSQKYIDILNKEEQVHIDIFNNDKFDISLSRAGLDTTLQFVKSENNDTYNCVGDKIIPLFYRRGGNGISPYICTATTTNIFYVHTLKIIKKKNNTTALRKEFGVYCEGNLLATGNINYKEKTVDLDIIDEKQYSRYALEELKFVAFLWVYKCALSRVDKTA